MELEATTTTLEELSKRMSTTREASSERAATALASHWVIRVVAIVKSLAEFCNSVFMSGWSQIELTRCEHTGVAEHFVCFVDCSHLCLASTLVRVSRHGGFPAVHRS